jgi:isopenicillin N synthase-like dioxygenase
VSTVHRVVVPEGPPRPSLSLGFFHQPDADALVEALPSCVSAAEPARYPPVRAGEHLAAKMARQHAPAPG